MKIAILSFYSGINNRGVERWTYELASRLSGKHDITVFQNEKSKQFVKYKVTTTNITFNKSKRELLLPLQRRLFLDYKSRKILQFTFKSVSVILKNKFDVIIPTDGGWEPAIIRILTWLKGGKVVIVGHSGVGWDDINNLWTFPDIFIALSEYAKKWAAKINPLVKLISIPDGVDIDKFNPDGIKINLTLKKPIILCVSSDDAGKRLELLVDAVSRVGGVSLLVLGVDQGSKIFKYGKEILGKRFSVKKVWFTEIPKYYRVADLFTLPAWEREAFGMVYLEAMASGLAVVANNDPIRREIVGNAGIFIDPTNTFAYAEAIKDALSKNWSDSPRLRAMRFSWDRIVADYEKVFEVLTHE